MPKLDTEANPCSPSTGIQIRIMPPKSGQSTKQISQLSPFLKATQDIFWFIASTFVSLNSRHPLPTMPRKSNSQKKKEAEAAGKAPKKTKQEENAGKSAKQKKEETHAKRAADREKKSGGW